MTIKTILLFYILIIFAACNAQDQKTSENKVLKTISINIGDTVSAIGKNIDCILQDKKGNYWIASNGEGVFHFDGKVLTHITDEQGLCNNFVLAIQQDIKGNIWFSTRDGFCRFNGTTFVDYTDVIINAPDRKLNHVEGGIFFGHSNGICFYDGIKFTNFTIHPESYSTTESDINRPYSIYSSLVDNSGNIWFGTQSQGVCRYDGTTFSYLTEKDLAGSAVRAIFQDKAGILWFGNNGGGLYRYDGKTLTNITEEKGLGNPEFLKGIFNDKPGSLARVWAINEDDQGNFWIGTIDAGVWKFDGTNLINYTTEDGLTGNSIWAIYKNNQGELFFVTNGDAICKFNGKLFERYEFGQ